MAIGDESNDVDHHEPVNGVYMPNPEVRQVARINNMETYRKMYKKSIDDPETFWTEMSEGLYWKAPPPGDFYSYNFDVARGPINIKWLEGAKTNIVYNALDRHVKMGHGERVAYFW